MLPSFIHIGPGRAATTTLYEALRQHPDVCMAKNTKETNYFDRNFNKGIGWYQSFFSHCSDSLARGEISTTYIYDPAVPPRIASVVPDVRLLTVLRNPFERIKSVFAYRRRAGTLDFDLSLAEAIEEHPDLVAHNYYGDQLERFLAHFPRRNLHVAFFDELTRDPERFMRDILRFIGINGSYVPQAVYERFNSRVIPRMSQLAPVTRFVADALRRWELYSVLTRAKRSEVLRSLLFDSGRETAEGIQGDQEVEEALLTRFLPQIAKVESITGQSLTHWYPDHPS